MKTLKYFVVLLILSLGIIALTACGSDNADSQENQEQVSLVPTVATITEKSWQTDIILNEYLVVRKEGWENDFRRDTNGRMVQTVELSRYMRDNHNRPKYRNQSYSCTSRNWDGTPYPDTCYRRVHDGYYKDPWVIYDKYELVTKFHHQLSGNNDVYLFQQGVEADGACHDTPQQLIAVGDTCTDHRLNLSLTFSGSSVDARVPVMQFVQEDFWRSVNVGDQVMMYITEDGKAFSFPSLSPSEPQRILAASWQDITVRYDGLLTFHKRGAESFYISNPNRGQPQEIIWRPDGDRFIVVYPKYIDMYLVSDLYPQTLEDLSQTNSRFGDVDYGFTPDSNSATIASVVGGEEQYTQIKIWDNDETISKYVIDRYYQTIDLNTVGTALRTKADSWSDFEEICKMEFLFSEGVHCTPPESESES